MGYTYYGCALLLKPCDVSGRYYDHEPDQGSQDKNTIRTDAGAIEVKTTTFFPDRCTAVRKYSRSILCVVPILCLLALLVTPIAGAAAEPASGPGDGSLLTTLLMVTLGAAVLAGLIIFGLVVWGRKQDHIAEMVHFCLKFLVHSEDEEERCASARALGRANDPGALLVLLDVSLDDEEKVPVRRAAGEALHELGDHLRKYKKIITDIELCAEQADYQGIIKILTANFEKGTTRYAQSAYLIARLYMRLRRYVAAREWLMTAEIRNRRFNLYGNQIQRWIGLSNTRMLEEADDAFRNQSYQDAKKRYAALDQGLDDADRQRFAIYLRTACVFVELRDYRNADQALLQALSKNHGTDLALTLVPLLQEVMKSSDRQTVPRSAVSVIEKRASEIMKLLFSKQS